MAINWQGLFWEARNFLDVDEDAPIPLEELKETALANGWSEREFKEALRETDEVEPVGDTIGGDVRLTTSSDDVDETPEDPDAAQVSQNEGTSETSQTAQTTEFQTARELAHDVDVDVDEPGYEDVDWSDVQEGVDPAGSHDYDAWMPAKEKKPWNPGAQTENKFSWSNPENWTTAEKTQEWYDKHPFIDGRAFILQGDGAEQNYNGQPDPYLFVDYDDVVQDDGTPAPEAIELMNRLGFTYTDFSSSESGNHQIFLGSLPDGVRAISFELPNGAGEVEIYDQRRVCIMTGKHIVDTPTVPRPVDDVELLALAYEHGKQSANPTAADWEPEFSRDDLAEMETTDNLDAIFDAVRQVEPRDIHLRSSLTEERPDGTLSFDPTWANSSSGKRLGWGPDIGWIYRDGDRGLDALQVVALEERIITSVDDYPKGEDWWDAVEELRDRGARIPEYEQSASFEDGDDVHPLLRAALESDIDAEIDAAPTSALPLAQLEHLDQAGRRRAAQQRGLEWPSTRDVRDELLATISTVMNHQDTAVVDAPTAAGKSYTVATTPWNDPQYSSVSGGKPVVHLSQTRDARDEALRAAHDAGIDYFLLQSRHEACPVAAGDHDPREAADDEEKQPVTIDGTPASQWLEVMCEGKGIAFGTAHRYLEEHNDQDVELPCCRSTPTTYDEDEGDFDEGESGTCPAIEQWEDLREIDDSELDLIIATHNFAHVPGLRMGYNVVIDEEPDFTVDLTKDRIARAITAYLQEIDAVTTNWESFIQLSRHEAWDTDAASERDALQDQLNEEPERDWYFEHPDAHTLAPALARAIFHADEKANDRRVGKTPYEPPRLDAHAVDDDGWNRTWVTVTLDEDNQIHNVRTAPDFGQSRSVVGLDAHPARPIWMVNVHPHIQVKPVLDPEPRRLWRRYERGLRVVQVGDATRPLASGEYFQPRQVEALVQHLRSEYGDDFQTAITTKSVETNIQQILENAGVQDVDEKTMHYGEEKSRNDFANERVGLIEGCVDPGDDYVMNLIAELDLDASPETTTTEQGETKRAHGRGFTGADAETAQEILASVRENHTAQAVGRYARDPSDPDVHATVFVRTDAMPPGYADVEVPGVQWTFTEKQRKIVEVLRDHPGRLSALEVAKKAGCTKEHARMTMNRLAELGHVDVVDGAGDHGASLYADTGLPHVGVVELENANGHVRGNCTYLLAIRDPDRASQPPSYLAGSDQSGESADAAVWDWRDGPDPPG